MSRILFAATILLLSQVVSAAERPAVCDDGSCHDLAPGVVVSPSHLNSLVESLSIVAPKLAAEIDVQIERASCDAREVLDRHTLIEVSINPESRVKVDAGTAKPHLVTGRWNTFLVRVQNLGGVTAPLTLHSDQQRSAETSASRDRWVEAELVSNDPLSNVLSGLPLEYRIVRFRTDQIGTRAALCAMDVGQGTADIGFRNDVLLTFDCQVDLSGARMPGTPSEKRRWLENMIWHHGFSLAEIRAATGMSSDEIGQAMKRFDIRPENAPERPADAPLLVLPYPGGRHPRTGFLEGAIDPQRETKVSIFAPWDDTSYVVADVPEAIWSNLGLTFLAHTHIPTVWDQRDISLPRQEWQLHDDGSLLLERSLPEGIEFGTRLLPGRDGVRMQLWLHNGSDQPLTDLRVQNCVMLKAAKGFSSQTDANKIFWGPYAACRNHAGNRWVITAWSPLNRTWSNPRCPCLHSDPVFPDCVPGRTQHLRGWLSFYEGQDIHSELQRLESLGWRGSHDVDEKPKPDAGSSASGSAD